MRRLITALRRLRLRLQIYDLTLHIAGRQTCMEHTGCPLRLGNMTIAIHHDRQALARLQDEFNATLPPARRRTWSKDGAIYASDGCILVCIPDDPAIEAGEHGLDFHGRFYPGVAAGGLTPLQLALPAPDVCNDCGGTGRMARCPTCGGTGEFFKDGHDYDCKTCDALGQVSTAEAWGGQPEQTCRFCNGTGDSQYQTIPVGNTHFKRRYLALIADLPDLHFKTDAANKRGTAYFTFTGGWGALMPCTSD